MALYGDSSQHVLGVSMSGVLYLSSLLIISGSLSIGELTAFGISLF